MKRQTRCEKNKELVLKMISENHSLKSIGRAVGTTGNRVRDFVDSHGIEKEFPKTFSGSRNPAWKGGRTITKHGYVYVYSPEHPNRDYKKRVLEHRLVMEKMIGRFLLPKEVVHHWNGIPGDNRPENLQLFSDNSEHLKVDLKGRTPKWTADGLARMRVGVDLSANRRRGKNDWHWREKLKRGVQRSQ